MCCGINSFEDLMSEILCSLVHHLIAVFLVPKYNDAFMPRPRSHRYLSANYYSRTTVPLWHTPFSTYRN